MILARNVLLSLFSVSFVLAWLSGNDCYEKKSLCHVTVQAFAGRPRALFPKPLFRTRERQLSSCFRGVDGLGYYIGKRPRIAPSQVSTTQAYLVYDVILHCARLQCIDCEAGDAASLSVFKALLAFSDISLFSSFLGHSNHTKDFYTAFFVPQIRKQQEANESALALLQASVICAMLGRLLINGTAAKANV